MRRRYRTEGLLGVPPGRTIDAPARRSAARELSVGPRRKEHSEHDDVVSSLTDLQRRLREADGRAASTIVEPHPAQEEQVEVAEQDMIVRMTSVRQAPESDEERRERFAPVTQLPTSSGGLDRVAALTERLSRLERELSGVLGSLDSMRVRVAAEATADVAARMVGIQRETDERTASVVTRRMDAVSSRITSELEEQRADLVDLLDRRMADMKVTLRDAILEAAQGLEDGSEPPTPAG
jgi:hypothetical protein